MKNIGSMQETFLSDGWAAIKHQTKEKMDATMLQLASVDRPKEMSDDTLRGLIFGLYWVLNFEVRATRALAEAEADRTEQPAEESGVGSPMESEVPTE